MREVDKPLDRLLAARLYMGPNSHFILIQTIQDAWVAGMLLSLVLYTGPVSTIWQGVATDRPRYPASSVLRMRFILLRLTCKLEVRDVKIAARQDETFCCSAVSGWRQWPGPAIWSRHPDPRNATGFSGWWRSESKNGWNAACSTTHVFDISGSYIFIDARGGAHLSGAARANQPLSIPNFPYAPSTLHGWARGSNTNWPNNP